MARMQAARLDYEEREDLYTRMNRLPTIFEVVTGKAKASGVGAHRKAAAAAARAAKEEAGEAGEGAAVDGGEASLAMGEEEGGGEEEGDPCPQCGKGYRSDEFWIACDFCDTWYCGKVRE